MIKFIKSDKGRFYCYLKDCFLGFIVMSNDGYYYFEPYNWDGIVQSFILRQIAEKLEELNKDLDIHLSYIMAKDQLQLDLKFD